MFENSYTTRFITASRVETDIKLSFHTHTQVNVYTYIHTYRVVVDMLAGYSGLITHMPAVSVRDSPVED